MKWASASSHADMLSASGSSSIGCTGPPLSARDNPGARSQAGDLDLTIYSLRKWARLALQGNPTVLLLLYLPDEALMLRTNVGKELQKLAPAFASRHAGKRFLGYLEAQRERLVGERGQRDVNRVELVEQFGYDTKYAMHMLRLGHQGVEFLESGRLTLPMRDPVRSHLMDVRQGRSNLADVLAECTQLELRLAALLDSSPLPTTTRLKDRRTFCYGYLCRRLDQGN